MYGRKGINCRARQALPGTRRAPATRGYHARMDTPAWTSRVEHATSIDEVIKLVCDYVQSRKQEDMARLPQECRFDCPLDSPEVVADCAYRLAAYHPGQEGDAELIERLSGFFSRASVRLAELAHRI